MVTVSVAALVAAPPAASSPGIRVDPTAYPTIAVSVVAPQSTQPNLTEDRVPVKAVYAGNVGSANALAVVIDRSRSMRGAPLRNAVGVAQQLLADKPQAERIAVFAVAADAVQLTRFSQTTVAARKALARLKLAHKYGTVLYDAVARAAGALARQPGHEKTIVLITDGHGTAGTDSVVGATVAATHAGAAVYPVAIKDKTAQQASLTMLARATRGAFFGSKTERSPRDYAAIASDIRRTWRIDYITSARPGSTIVVRAHQAGTRPIAGGARIPGRPPQPFLTRPRVVLLVAAAILVLGLLFVIARGGDLRRR